MAPRIFSDTDFVDAPQAPAGRVFSEADFADSAEAPSQPQTLGQRALGVIKDPLGSIAEIGRFANRGNQEIAGLMAEKGGIPGVIAGTALGTASEFLLPQNRLGAGLMMLPGAAKAVGEYRSGFSSLDQGLRMAAGEAGQISRAANKSGAAVQALKAYPKIQERYGAAALKNPDILRSAPSIEQASQGYADAAGGLAGKAQSIGARLNKTVVTPADYDAAINRAGRIVNGTEIDAAGNAVALTPQDALEGLQSINDALRNKEFTRALGDQEKIPILDLKDKLLDFLQNNGNPNMRAAGKKLFEAHVKDAFSDWFPRNKYGSTDALRSVAGLGSLAGGIGLLLSNPAAAVPLLATGAAMSPKVAGYGIRATAGLGDVLGNPIFQKGISSMRVRAGNVLGGTDQQQGIPDAMLRGGTMNITNKVVSQSMAK